MLIKYYRKNWTEQNGHLYNLDNKLGGLNFLNTLLISLRMKKYYNKHNIKTETSMYFIINIIIIVNCQ